MMALSTVALSAASYAAENEKPDVVPGAQYFEGHKGEDQIPAALVRRYGEFAEGARDPGGDFLSSLLPASIGISTRERPAATRYHGSDLNLPFLRKEFEPHVWVVLKNGADCYLLRTTTSTLWFVETKSQGWRLYRYLDKPMM